MKSVQLFFLLFLLLSSCKDYCDYLEDIDRKELAGLIEKKTKHFLSKNETSIKINTLGNEETITFLSDENSGIVDYIVIGDSLIKRSNTLLVRIRKPNGDEMSFDLSRPGCHN
jgi:hypothetical protein